MKIFGFDYDGTIINIEPEKAAAFGELVEKEWSVDKKEAADFWMSNGGTSRRHKFDHFYEKIHSKKLPEDTYFSIERTFSALLKQIYYPKIELLPHALDILKFTREKFDYLFISSGVPMEEIRYLVKLNGVSDYFDEVLGTSAEYVSKREHFKKILETHSPSLFIFMGDAIEDIQVANEFGAISIGLPTNLSKELLEGAGARFVCSLKESKSIIERLL